MFKVGIIGAGHIAEKMATTLHGMEGVEAYAVAARQMEKAQDFASRRGFTKAYGSYEALADDQDVDLIYVATPHSLHYSHVKMCLEKGRPVLCEKAFMANAREAADVIRLSEEKDVFLAEAIWTRYLPFRQTVRRLIDGGAIGRTSLLTAHLGYPVTHKERIMKPELGGGALLDLGVYAINFALMNFGNDIRKVSSCCIKSETGIDLQDSITFEYTDGRMAQLMATACCANDRQGIINGEKGYIVLDNINNPLKADIYSSDHILVDTQYAPQQITGFEYQVQACIDAIRDGRTETEFMPHSESLEVMKIMDSLRKEWGVTFPNDSVAL